MQLAAALHFNDDALWPYVVGACAQFIQGAGLHLAARDTELQFSSRLRDTSVAQPCGVPDGVPLRLLIPLDLQPATVLSEASRARNTATLITGISMIAVPIWLTVAGSARIIVLTVLIAALLSGLWLVRKTKIADKKFSIFSAVTVAMVAINVLIGLGAALLIKAPTHEPCPPASASTTPESG